MIDTSGPRTPWILPLAASLMFACPAAGTEQGAPAKADGAEQEGAAKAEGGAKQDGGAAPEGDQPAGDPPAAEDKKAEARAKFDGRDEAEIVAARAKMLATLNEGRKLVKDGKLDEGIAKYKELLAIDPHYGPALGELGWAEFQAQRYESAKTHTQKALARAPDNKRRGMLHYNLGRIAEAQDQTEVAIEAYALSLSLRPNEVVAKRLALISHVESAEGFAAEHPAVTAYEAARAPGAALKPVVLKVVQEGVDSVETACKTLVGDYGEDVTCELVASPGADASWGMIAVDFFSIERHWHPAVKTDAGWTVFEVAIYGQHGSEIDQDVDSLAARLVTNEAGSFLFVDYSDHLYERDWSWGELEEDEEIPDSESSDSKGVIICARAPKPVCVSPILTSWDYSFGDERRQFSASVTMKGATIVIADVETEGPIEYGVPEEEWDPHLPLPAGEHALAGLF